MMELTPSALSGEYEQYEMLIIKKEQYEKEAELANLAYMREFGELASTVFELKIECIALKKQISMFITAKNTATRVNEDEILERLEAQMLAYRMELADMLSETEAARKVVDIPEADVLQIKTIYRRLAKLLHPDISPITSDYPQLGELFNRVVMAYKCNDLKELRQLEVLVNRELEENGIDRFDMAIPDIEKRIEELEQDIDDIVTTIPYTYRLLLEDAGRVAEEKAEFDDEIKNYTAYKAELSAELERIKKELKNDGLIE